MRVKSIRAKRWEVSQRAAGKIEQVKTWEGGTNSKLGSPFQRSCGSHIGHYQLRRSEQRACARESKGVNERQKGGNFSEQAQARTVPEKLVIPTKSQKIAAAVPVQMSSCTTA